MPAVVLLEVVKLCQWRLEIELPPGTWASAYATEGKQLGKALNGFTKPFLTPCMLSCGYHTAFLLPAAGGPTPLSLLTQIQSSWLKSCLDVLRVMGKLVLVLLAAHQGLCDEWPMSTLVQPVTAGGGGEEGGEHLLSRPRFWSETVPELLCQHVRILCASTFMNSTV